MNSRGVRAGPSRTRLAVAFASVYLAWGSTYLAIRFAIETLPPFLMAGVRFLIAGSLLYGWARARGAGRPDRSHWIATAVVGALLLLGGNGAVVWAEQRVASGLAALLVAMVPVWMVLLDSLWHGGPRPGRRVVAGLFLGLAGLALLVGPNKLMGSERIDPWGVGVLVGGSVSWAVGSIYSRRARLPRSSFQTTAMEMLAGGVLLVLAGLLAGEPGRLIPSAVSALSVLAVGYLIVVGSLVGFNAYIWLLGATTPARASTYAYVNPVVALFLGWAVAGEPITVRTLLSAVIIVAAVALIIAGGSDGGHRTRPARPREEEAVEAPAPV